MFCSVVYCQSNKRDAESSSYATMVKLKLSHLADRIMASQNCHLLVLHTSCLLVKPSFDLATLSVYLAAMIG